MKASRTESQRTQFGSGGEDDGEASEASSSGATTTDSHTTPAKDGLEHAASAPSTEGLDQPASSDLPERNLDEYSDACARHGALHKAAMVLNFGISNISDLLAQLRIAAEKDAATILERMQQKHQPANPSDDSFGLPDSQSFHRAAVKSRPQIATNTKSKMANNPRPDKTGTGSVGTSRRSDPTKAPTAKASTAPQIEDEAGAGTKARAKEKEKE